LASIMPPERGLPQSSAEPDHPIRPLLTVSFMAVKR
jgi:hypothetical protein